MKTPRASLIVSTALGTWTLAGLAVKPAYGASTRPNVLIYITDDIDFNEIGFFDPMRYPNWQSARAAGVLEDKRNSYGEFKTRPLTPRIDQLAREGIVFEQFRVVSPMCVPSRYGMLTGQLPSRAQAFTGGGGRKAETRFPGPGMHLADGQWQLSHAFKAAGYATGMVGKWHISAWHDGPGKIRPPFADYRQVTVRPGSPDDAEVNAEIRRVYDEGRRHMMEAHGFDWVDGLYMANINELGLPMEMWEHSEGSKEWITEQGLRFLEEHRDRPFFLYFSTFAPHGMAGTRFLRSNPRDTTAGRLAETPQGMPDRPTLPVRLREAGIDPETMVSTWIDDSVGALLNKLEKLGLAENTIVVFTSDHQSYGKWTCYESARVPFILRWKGQPGQARVVEDSISAVDLVPTLLELAGIAPLPSDKVVLDGRSFASVVTDPTATLPPEPVFIEFGFGRAIVDGDYKYIALRFPPAIQRRREQTGEMPRYHGEFGKSERESQGFPNYGAADQLYNLREDVFEQKNLANDPAHRAKLEELHSKLKAKLQEIGLPFGEFVAANTGAKP
jgi:arylsulfatase A-like enzyme